MDRLYKCSRAKYSVNVKSQLQKLFGVMKWDVHFNFDKYKLAACTCKNFAQ